MSEQALSNETETSPTSPKGMISIQLRDKGSVLKIKKMVDPSAPVTEDSNTVSPIESQERLNSLNSLQ